MYTIQNHENHQFNNNPQCQNAFLNELTSGYPNLQVVGSTHSPFVLAGAEKTAAFNLETGQMHEHLAWMGFKEIAERVFGVVEYQKLMESF